MGPKLKEEPREWQKFTLVMAILVSLLAYGGYRRHWLPQGLLTTVLLVAGTALLGCALKPRWFRGFYRGGTKISFQIGQFMGRVLLTIFFWCALTPLGVLLRVLGKDLLHLKKHPETKTYWQPAKADTQFDRMF
jgi:hypothetical protein